MNWFSDVIDWLLGFWIHAKYLLAIALCGIVRALYKFFELFAGLAPVTYQNKEEKLINVFFYNQTVTNAYWGMCLIGIVMAFGFALIAIIRKMFDLGGRNQQTMGSIIGNFLRSIFLMISLTFGMMIVLEFSDRLMNQINYLFNNASSLHMEKERTFKDEELSAMARVLNTIGNYSMNASYNSRYNLNACYNDIRPEMEWLQKQGVFDYAYPRKNEKGEIVNTWQNALQRIAEVKKLSEPARADVYDEQLSTALMDVMEIIRTDKNFRPIKTYVRNDYQVYSQRNSVPLDRMCFLAGTMDAAINEEFNKNPSVSDALRGRFYVDSSAGGDRSIYNYADVLACFHTSEIDYLYIWLTCLFMAAELLAIVGNCVARIFNVIFLYLIAPPFFASWPLDNGGKAKQWLTAFLIQNFSVFATVMSVRVVQIFIPIITAGDLIIVDWRTWGGTWAEMNWAAPLDYLAKLMMILIAFMTARKASGVVTGILADSAGWQAIGAADSIGQAMRGMVGKAAGKAVGMAGQGIKGALGAKGGGGAGGGAGGEAGGGEGGESGGSSGGDGGGSGLPSKSNLGGAGGAGAGGAGAGGAGAAASSVASGVGSAISGAANTALGKKGGGGGAKPGAGGGAKPAEGAGAKPGASSALPGKAGIGAKPGAKPAAKPGAKPGAAGAKPGAAGAGAGAAGALPGKAAGAIGAAVKDAGKKAVGAGGGAGAGAGAGAQAGEGAGAQGGEGDLLDAGIAQSASIAAEGMEGQGNVADAAQGGGSEADNMEVPQQSGEIGGEAGAEAAGEAGDGQVGTEAIGAGDLGAENATAADAGTEGTGASTGGAVESTGGAVESGAATSGAATSGVATSGVAGAGALGAGAVISGVAGAAGAAVSSSGASTTGTTGAGTPSSGASTTGTTGAGTSSSRTSSSGASTGGSTSGGASSGGAASGGGSSQRGGVLASMVQDFAEYSASGLISAATGADVNVSFDGHWNAGGGQQGPPPPSKNDEDDELMPEDSGENYVESDSGTADLPDPGANAGQVPENQPNPAPEFNAANAQPGNTVNLNGTDRKMPPLPLDQNK